MNTDARDHFEALALRIEVAPTQAEAWDFFLDMLDIFEGEIAWLRTARGTWRTDDPMERTKYRMFVREVVKTYSDYLSAAPLDPDGEAAQFALGKLHGLQDQLMPLIAKLAGRADPERLKLLH